MFQKHFLKLVRRWRELQIGACYTRKSTEDQSEYSIDAQLKLIKNYCKQNDIILPKEFIFIDDGISGRRAEKRPAFMQMIATAKMKPKKFDVILVHKFDRFARSREDSVVYKSLLKKECGIKVVSITESIEDDKFSVILEAMLEAMAEYYSLNLSEEVLKGMTEKASRGEYQTAAPFGYKMVEGKLEIVEEEAKIIKLIFEKFSSKEMGMQPLARYINNLGFRTHRGNCFENRTIDYILNNPVYMGQVRWCPEGRLRREFKNPKAIIADGQHEPIISKELWEETQKVLRGNKEIYRYKERKTAKISSWLKGLVRCENCGSTLVVQGKKYMQCNSYLKGACNISCHVIIEDLEKSILEKLKETFDEKLSIEIVPKQRVRQNTDVILLNELLKKLDEKEKRIKIAYVDGIDTLEEYKQNKDKIANERTELIEQLKSIKSDLQGEEVNEEIYNKICSVYELLSDENIDIKTKYETAHFLIEKITYSRQTKTLKLTYK